MSDRAPAWWERKYVAGVTHMIQSRGNLLGMTSRPADRQNGNEFVWKVAGTGEASERSAATDHVNVMNLDRTNVTATVKGYEANDWVDIADIAQMSENEMQVTQQSGAMAIGRRIDRTQMEALAATPGITSVGAAATQVDPTTFMLARDQILALGVGSYEIYCGLPVNWSSQLALYKEYSHADWAGPEHPLLKQIGARTVWGINFIPLPDSYFVKPTGTSLEAYLWVKDCVGSARPMDVRSRTDYIPDRKKWLVANDVMLCAVGILADGIKKIVGKHDATLVRPAT